MGRVIAAIALLAVPLTMGATTAVDRTEARVARCSAKAWKSGLPYFSQTSPLNLPIRPATATHPGSARMVEALGEAGSDHHFVLSVGAYTVPVYYAAPGTRRFVVRLTASWATRRAITGVPIPANARPDPGTDGHMAIVDRATGCEYDFWQASRGADGSWTASWGNRTALAGVGIFRGSAGARASGFALLAGLVFPNELRRGLIDHALAIAVPNTRRGAPIPPATWSDGGTDGPEGIPMGARLQLDPELDLSTLGLSRYELVIARALQVYGAFVVDTGGAVALFAANPLGFRRNPYVGLIPDKSYAPLDGIPLARFRAPGAAGRLRAAGATRLYWQSWTARPAALAVRSVAPVAGVVRRSDDAS